ncbi:hypothetical protein [Tranquillimonas alkanivorans]|uniref:Uncharacterized protein n=1 Tax=Tranquillimonas alkanivorans TaxID=441119 RepID=A0A1I5PET8_9RHOB|nr:hypothetical protein [Tranquillimonas alkanivorans]SFP32608.1 hypothetical protein SAMN04488047_10573 [Tranquillimonas alkanivorans]
MRTLAVLPLLALAAPAAAQETVSPEALAAYAAEVCVQRTPGPGDIETGEMELVERGDELATFAHPSGLVMALTSRPEFFSCEIEVPEATEGYFDALMQAFAPRLQEVINADDHEQVEDGMVWEGYTETGALITTELQYHEGGRITLTSSTQTTQAPPAPRDLN